MKRRVLFLFPTAVALVILLGPAAPPAKAIKPFFEEFEAVYLKRDSSDAKDKSFVAVVEKAKCNVCHEGKSKKERNIYGMALDMLLDKKADKDDKEKIKKALATVAELKSDPVKSDSPTFGQLIAQGKLPGGEAKPDTDSTASQ